MKSLAIILGTLLGGFGAVFAQQLPEALPVALQPLPGVLEPLAEGLEQENPGSGLLDDRRDPFRPFTLDLRPDGEGEELLTPLQRYELPQLRVVAVLLKARPPRAMLEDSSGMGFIVMPGTLIGRHHGVVSQIKPREIVVEEMFLDFYGREQVREVVLEMADEERRVQE